MHFNFLRDVYLELENGFLQDPAYVDVPRLSRLCPDISAISLSVPFSINEAGEVSTNVRHCDSILDALSASDLTLRVVELQHFPFDDSFRNFLRSKGGGIEELLFRGDGPLNSTHVAFIGGIFSSFKRLCEADYFLSIVC